MGIRVYLADDHAVLREGLRAVLENQSDIEVVGEAADGRAAVRDATALRPDIVLMDIAMPGLNGIEATARVLSSCPDIGVVILSMHSTKEHIFRALEAGASGYVLKESASQEVVEAVRAVAGGRRYLSRRIEDQVIERSLPGARRWAVHSPLDSLSTREREILQLVVEGKSSSAIAEALYLSPKTIETYRSRMMQKLGISDLPSLVRFAIQQGLISVDR
jgi:DNA-binding NarL/FixJ family response regulator